MSNETTIEIWKTWKETSVIPFGNLKAAPHIIKWEVSNLGNARRNGIPQRGIIDRGYVYIGGRAMHRIVANLFIPKIEGKTHVDHINGIRSDNRVCNLRWCTRKENMNFPLAKEHISLARKGKYGGVNSPNYGKKWTEEQKLRASQRAKEMATPEFRKKVSISRTGSHRVYHEDGTFHFEH